MVMINPERKCIFNPTAILSTPKMLAGKRGTKLLNINIMQKQLYGVYNDKKHDQKVPYQSNTVPCYLYLNLLTAHTLKTMKP